jgi:hypothetical protein
MAAHYFSLAPVRFFLCLSPCLEKNIFFLPFRPGRNMAQACLFQNRFQNVSESIMLKSIQREENKLKKIILRNLTS